MTSTDRYREHVRQEADHRTALTVALLGAVGVVAVALQLAGTVPLPAVLVGEVVAAAAITMWQARTLRTPALVARWLNRKGDARG